MMGIVNRLTAEEARMTRLWECAEDFRTKHHGTPAAFDFNTLKHAVSGRDPVLTEAAAEIARLRAERDAAVARAERMEAALVAMLDLLMAESGRGIDYGHEDAFRMGEWFEAEDVAKIEAARALLAKLKELENG